MDGYAVRVEDLPTVGAQLQVTQRIPAGHHGNELQPGQAARIFTGAPIPPGANAVVMQEQVHVLDDVAGATAHTCRTSQFCTQGGPMDTPQWGRCSQRRCGVASRDAP
jgi:molybdopterin molybdotransferase